MTDNAPRIYIQWKGTEVCADIYCVCGTHGHIDDWFMYYVRCKDCGQVYRVDHFIGMTPDYSEEGVERAIEFTKEDIETKSPTLAYVHAFRRLKEEDKAAVARVLGFVCLN